jgi:hypothetical protein
MRNQHYLRTPMNLQIVVEGDGEFEAAGVLARRVLDLAGCYGVRVLSPIRQKRSKLMVESEFLRTLEISLGTPNLCGVLFIFDSDDDPTCKIAARCMGWIEKRNPPVLCEITIATKEYEAWFLGSITSLRGFRGVHETAMPIADPENIRDAKGRLCSHMSSNRKYAPAFDQAAFSSAFDLKLAYQNCRSFRKLIKAFRTLIPEDMRLNPLPPEDWVP